MKGGSGVYLGYGGYLGMLPGSLRLPPQVLVQLLCNKEVDELKSPPGSLGTIRVSVLVFFFWLLC